MSGWQLTLKASPALRVDLRGVTPAALADLALAEVERWPVGYGNAWAPLAEFFKLAPHDSDALIFDGDLSRFDRVGWQLAGGRIHVHGNVGHHAGGCMSAGELLVDGRAGLLAACEMAGGSFTVQGDVDDFAASTLPGSMDGMRGGTFVVKGNAGARFGDRMRRGSAIVHGDAGDFLASRLVAGTIAVGGRAGAHAGWGMRRGSVVFATGPAALDVAATFVPALAAADVFWQLLARDLARHGGPFATLGTRRIERHLGDLAVDGRGEIIIAR
ncbi:formylmethanofuran dehydrogenase subunit C [Variovorax sp. J22R24]|uniref:formylmethanofuran dehydrogenase subunit C n=1 Tax=Variovorax gracilis TaxID=3053502 RepID=UPI002577F479|nr:formylmethanofuran dehydrogenase subunit C [Variovorax sp. J22R24]MDM0103497.1 formylmethanofuran dehydrogenase subunit C [Variovorax sp. J22R24]